MKNLTVTKWPSLTLTLSLSLSLSLSEDSHIFYLGLRTSVLVQLEVDCVCMKTSIYVCCLWMYVVYVSNPPPPSQNEVNSRGLSYDYNT